MELEPDSAGRSSNGRLVTRAVAAAQRRTLDRIEASGLPGQWFAALHLFLHSPDHRLSMSRIARDLSMTTGGFTKLADRLGSEGLIDRRNASGDRRMIFAVLTPKGLEVAQRAAADYEAAVNEHVVSVISAERLSAVAHVMRVLDAADHERQSRAEPTWPRNARRGPARAPGPSASRATRTRLRGLRRGADLSPSASRRQYVCVADGRNMSKRDAERRIP